jgi:hypothetical protein
VIENVFKEDIRIESVNSSCGCTSVSLEKRTLKTWEKAELVARFNTVGFSGQRQATVTVRFSAPYTGEVQLQVKGNIRTDVQVAPGDINFGTINPSGMSGAHSLTSASRSLRLNAIKTVSTICSPQRSSQQPLRAKSKANSSSSLLTALRN